ncbi:uncharacterized protein LOC105200389 isoform X5 [Solenopsis invicta]|uniref:uncharacterized protein LOC105200389 isoform X5 n=1 Tax=Solenopsis invicta TaxID=13686 RepID=UPI00193D85B6|nr:uncharacterized protein LOC105200389 isoform X5 [Solenopsis invicta]
MDSSETSKLWQDNSNRYNRQNRDNIKWEILENHGLLMARLQTNVKDPLDITDASYYEICHRAMVSKFWCHEIGRKWRQATRQEPLQARVLSQSKCKSYVAIWYLYYRWLIFLIWTAFVICSVFEFGSYKPLMQYEKWPIYLTNWGMALGFTQALVGGILVSKRWRLQKIPGFDPCGLKLEFTERLYWFLYVVATNFAIGVTRTVSSAALLVVPVDHLVLRNLFDHLLFRWRPQQEWPSLHLQSPRLEETDADVAHLYWWFHIRDSAALCQLYADEHQRPNLSQDCRKI